MVRSLPVTVPRFPAFAWFASSHLAAQMSEQIALIAIPILAVTSFDADGGVTSAMQMLNTLPYLLLAIPFGVLADRSSPRRIMALGETIRTMSLVLLLWMAVSGEATVQLLALLGMLGSIGTVAHTVGAPSVVPRLVSSPDLPRANARLELYRSVAYAAGPAIGGAMVGELGAKLAFLLAAALSTVALAFITRLPAQPAAVKHSARPLQQIVEGIRFVKGHEYLRPIVLTAVLFNTAWFCLQGVYVAYAIDRLDMTARQAGTTLALYGVGMIVGARLATMLAERFSFGNSIIVGPLFGATASLIMLTTLAVPSMLLPCISYVMLGMGPIVWTISTTTLRQIVTPPAMLGRVSAVIVTSTAGFRPVGAGLGALAFTLGGYEPALAISTLGFLLQAMVILRSPAARIETIAAVHPAPAT